MRLVLAALDQESIGASEISNSNQIMGDFVKWSIGGHSQVQTGLPRFMLTVYNTFFSKDRFGLHETFKSLIQVRDILAGRNVHFDNLLLPGRFNGCRLQIYPSGGGFMGAHTDRRAVKTIEGMGPHIQLVMLLSQKGVDYQRGGAYVSHQNQFIDVEDNSCSGDVIVYNGDTLHGVDDIDPHLPFDRRKITGRMCALVTIYSNINLDQKPEN
jgi:hypothetical protein